MSCPSNSTRPSLGGLNQRPPASQKGYENPEEVVSHGQGVKHGTEQDTTQETRDHAEHHAGTNEPGKPAHLDGNDEHEEQFDFWKQGRKSQKCSPVDHRPAA